MATKLYALYRGLGAPPAPWSRVNTYNDRYIKATDGYASHGVTGGALQHTHGVSAWSGYSGSTSGFGGTGLTVQNNHNHSTTGGASASNNDPLYYTLSLISCDLVTWEANYRYFPAGCVFLSEILLNWNEVTRLNADNRLLKLGATADQVGGADVDGHTVSIYLAETALCTNVYYDVGEYPAYIWGSCSYHSHSADIYTSRSNKPKRIRTRWYTNPSDTFYSWEGIICFVDGTPSSNWSVLDPYWTDAYVESADENANVVGSNTSSHPNLSGSSSIYSSGWGYTSGGGWGPCPSSHNHGVGCSISDANLDPLNVKLRPVRLNTTLNRLSTKENTVALDVLMRMEFDSESAFDVQLKKAQTASMSIDLLNRGENEFETSADTVLKMSGEGDAAIDTILKTQHFTAMYGNVLLSQISQSYYMGVRLIKPYFTPPPLIHTMFSAFIDQLDKLQQDMQGLTWANQPENSGGHNLDRRFGDGFNIPRWNNESDWSYRKRIITFFSVISGSGTKSLCKFVLDQLIEEPGSSIVEPVYPATVRVNFATDAALRKVIENRSLFEYTLEQMLAAGVGYSLYTPLCDYAMAAHFKGMPELYWSMDTLLQHRDHTVEYYLGARIVTSPIFGDLSMDVLLRDMNEETSIRNQCRLSKAFSTERLFSTSIKDVNEIPFVENVRIKNTIISNLIMHSILKKYDLHTAIVADILLQRSMPREFSIGVELFVETGTRIDMDMLLKLRDKSKSHRMTARLANRSTVGISMGVSLVES
jgi:hypothetical protein